MTTPEAAHGAPYPDGFLDACELAYDQLGPLRGVRETLGCWIFTPAVPQFTSGPIGVVIATGEPVFFHIPALIQAGDDDNDLLVQQFGMPAHKILEALREENAAAELDVPERFQR